jgi:hypothetical protein
LQQGQLQSGPHVHSPLSQQGQPSTHAQPFSQQLLFVVATAETPEPVRNSALKSNALIMTINSNQIHKFQKHSNNENVK